jgi:hypothetical protein
LKEAWRDVQKGKLSASAFSQFENTAIPLTTATNHPHVVPFSSDTSLERAALDEIQSKISTQDKNTLRSLVGNVRSKSKGCNLAPNHPKSLAKRSCAGQLLSQHAILDRGDTALQRLSKTGQSQIGRTEESLSVLANNFSRPQ